MKKINSKKGFTLVELSLALVFLAIILLTIAWLTMHITSTYEKGLAMKAVNSTAKEIIDDMSRAIAQSPARIVESLCGSIYSKKPVQKSNCIADKARKFMYQERYGNVKVNGEVQSVPINGSFCTGRYSYIWNTAYALNTADYPPQSSGVNYAANINGDATFRLRKITDFERKVCTQQLVTTYNYGGNLTYTVDWNPEINEEMLDNSENNLALYDMAVYAPTIHKLTGSGFYSASFILATLRGGVNINSYGDFCTDPPDNLDTDFAYCAINKFNFSMRAAGEKTTTER